MTTTFKYEKKETLLDIQNVSISYGDKLILRDISATIKNVVRPDMEQGQITCLLGPSGIGKSTLFKVLSGLITPDTGEVLVGATGKNVHPGDVGVVAQNYPLIEHRTIRGNLVYAAKKAGYKGSDIKDLVEQIANEFGIVEHLNKYPIQLSGGQRQRAAIAQQLICSKHYLIMDEPFSGLDVVALSKVRQVMLEMSQRHEENTLIVITHDVTSAVSIADTIWLMGRDRDEQGTIIPGARLMEEIDLIERDICWHSDTTNRPAAIALIREIKEKFLDL